MDLKTRSNVLSLRQVFKYIKGFCIVNLDDYVKLSTPGLELKKICKSPFGDYRRKNGRQMQKCRRQIVQDRNSN